MRYNIGIVISKNFLEENIMKKLISILLVAVLLVTSVASFASCSGGDKIIVHTNAFFAPFEYYDGKIFFCASQGDKEQIIFGVIDA